MRLPQLTWRVGPASASDRYLSLRWRSWELSFMQRGLDLIMRTRNLWHEFWPHWGSVTLRTGGRREAATAARCRRSDMWDGRSRADCPNWVSGYERLAGLSWHLSTLPCGILGHNSDVSTENSTYKWAIKGSWVEPVQMHLQRDGVFHAAFLLYSLVGAAVALVTSVWGMDARVCPIVSPGGRKVSRHCSYD